MAKIQVTRTIPERKEQVTVKLKCDSCGKDSPFGDNWVEHSSEFIRVTMQKRTGWREYPYDTGWAQLTSYDICGDCFDKIVKTFSFGEPTITEYEY